MVAGRDGDHPLRLWLLERGAPPRAIGPETGSANFAVAPDGRSVAARILPDTITIYRGALCAFCSTEEELVHEVAVTVIHEIAHHFGIDEETLHALGWG